MTEVTANELPSEVESDNDTDDDSFLPDSNDPSGCGGSGSGSGIAGAASPASVRLILPKTRLGNLQYHEIQFHGIDSILDFCKVLK